jgi:hypothetical protein
MKAMTAQIEAEAMQSGPYAVFGVARDQSGAVADSFNSAAIVALFPSSRAHRSAVDAARSAAKCLVECESGECMISRRLEPLRRMRGETRRMTKRFALTGVRGL